VNLPSIYSKGSDDRSESQLLPPESTQARPSQLVKTLRNVSQSIRTHPKLLRDLGHIPQSPTSTRRTSSQREVINRVPLFEIASSGGYLIDKIEQLLADDADFTDNNRALKNELTFLRQTLSLTGLAIQTFEYTPLGQNLADSIKPEVEQCCTILQELYDSISNCRQGLLPTFIWSLWRHVWWNGYGADGQALLRTRLSARRILLGGCLMALNS
jgi:hypothetical protein